MMKTMKHIIWMVALALTAVTWSACSNNDALAVTEEPVQPRTYTVTTTLSPKGGAQTRSTMTDNGDGSISAEWDVGDQLYVGYENTSGHFVETTTGVTAVDPESKAATITVTLTDPIDDGDITFGYPLSFYNHTKKPYTDQLGTLDDINDNFAAISCSGKMDVDGSVVTLSGLTTMEQEMCIWKFSFTDGSSDITSAITKLVIEFPENSQTYSVTPSSQSTIYVAMYGDDPYSDVPMSITAQTATEVYHKSVASVTLDAGKTYTTTGLALSKAQVGKVFGADGNIYANADAATAASTTAVAMICYVGAAGSADSSTGSEAYMGLALALTDAGTTVKWCSQHGATCLPTQYASGQQTNDMAGIANTDYLISHDPDGHGHAAANSARNYNGGTHPRGTSVWFLPSAGQWDKMVNACKNVLGTENNYKDLRDGFSTRGGTNMLNGYYRTSTDNTYSFAFRFDFSTGNNGNLDYKYLNSCVRPAFAF